MNLDLEKVLQSWPDRKKDDEKKRKAEKLLAESFGERAKAIDSDILFVSAEIVDTIKGLQANCTLDYGWNGLPAFPMLKKFAEEFHTEDISLEQGDESGCPTCGPETYARVFLRNVQ